VSSDAGFIAHIHIDPAAVRIYAEGWQSWSPAGVFSWGERIPRPADTRLRDHFWRREASWFDPGVEVAGVVQADGGLLAVDPGTGEGVVVFSAPDPAHVPVIRATPRGERTLVITADRPCVARTYPGGIEQALVAWAEVWPSTWAAEPNPEAGPQFAGGDRQVPAAWCSWYGHGREVDFGVVDATMEVIERHRLPISTLLWDDGYFALLGDWRSSVRPDLGSLEVMAARIRDRGFRAGLWVCPTLADVRSDAAAQSEVWVPGIDAPFGSSRRVRVLDPTSAAGSDYLTALIGDLVAAGFELLKLDFLWTGALPGPRRSGADALAAYRQALALIREAAGPQVWLLGCGAPVLASVGAGLDAIRISPDIGAVWEPPGGDLSQPAGRSAVETGRARAYLHGRLLRADPDCLIAAPAAERRSELAEHIASLPGSVRMSGDRLADLDPWGLETTRRLLEPAADTTRKKRTDHA
jgi:alpha-galactosidase